jgi:hypothetical protein
MIRINMLRGTEIQVAANARRWRRNRKRLSDEARGGWIWHDVKYLWVF